MRNTLVQWWRSFRSLAASSGVALVLPALLIVGLLYVIPLAWLGAMSFGEHETSLASYRELFGPWSYTDILLHTFRLSAMVVAGCILFGYPIGYVLAFSSPRRRALLSLLVLLPFWTSVLVRNFAWIYLLRSGGVLSTAAGLFTQQGQPVQLLYNEAGVVIGMVSTFLPFMAIPVFVAISSQNQALREAAASLGASPALAFFAVTLPLSRAGLFAGSVLVFASSIGFFITPALLGGGRVLTAATFISQQVEEFVNWPLAAAAAMILLATVLVLIFLYRRLTGADAFGVEHEIS